MTQTITLLEATIAANHNLMDALLSLPPDLRVEFAPRVYEQIERNEKAAKALAEVGV